MGVRYNGHSLWMYTYTRYNGHSLLPDIFLYGCIPTRYNGHTLWVSDNNYNSHSLWESDIMVTLYWCIPIPDIMVTLYGCIPTRYSGHFLCVYTY